MLPPDRRMLTFAFKPLLTRSRVAPILKPPRSLLRALLPPSAPDAFFPIPRLDTPVDELPTSLWMFFGRIARTVASLSGRAKEGLLTRRMSRKLVLEVVHDGVE